jgi:hypothetical protein
MDRDVQYLLVGCALVIFVLYILIPFNLRIVRYLRKVYSDERRKDAFQGLESIWTDEPQAKYQSVPTGFTICFISPKGTIHYSFTRAGSGIDTILAIPQRGSRIRVEIEESTIIRLKCGSGGEIVNPTLSIPESRAIFTLLNTIRNCEHYPKDPAS